MLNSIFLYSIIETRKNRFLFDYRILSIMISSVHQYNIAHKYRKAIKNECV